MCPDSSAYIYAGATWEKGSGFLSTQGLQRLEVGPILMISEQQRSYLQTLSILNSFPPATHPHPTLALVA